MTTFTQEQVEEINYRCQIAKLAVWYDPFEFQDELGWFEYNESYSKRCNDFVAAQYVE